MSIERKRLLIEQAIAQGLKLYFFYDLFDREVQPYLIGPHNGEMRMLAYQVGGRTSQRNIPSWRCFRLAQITQLRAERKPSAWIDPPRNESGLPQRCINYDSEEEEAEQREEELFSWEDPETREENEYVVN